MDGITLISGPNKTNAGPFNLPAKFDGRIHAARWAEKGAEVEYNQQPQQIIGTRYQSNGWSVWLDPDKQKKPYEVKVASGKTYVLMFRDKALNSEVNKIYGDVSKRAINQELAGASRPKTPDGHVLPGMLTDAELASLEGPQEQSRSTQFNSSVFAQSEGGSLTGTQSTKEV